MYQDITGPGGANHPQGARGLIFVSGGVIIMSSQFSLSDFVIFGITASDWVTLISFSILLATFATLQLPNIIKKLSSAFGAIKKWFKSFF